MENLLLGIAVGMGLVVVGCLYVAGKVVVSFVEVFANVRPQAKPKKAPFDVRRVMCRLFRKELTMRNTLGPTLLDFIHNANVRRDHGYSTVFHCIEGADSFDVFRHGTLIGKGGNASECGRLMYEDYLAAEGTGVRRTTARG